MNTAFDSSVDELLKVMPEDLILRWSFPFEGKSLKIQEAVAMLDVAKKEIDSRRRKRQFWSFCLLIIATLLGVFCLSRLLPDWASLGAAFGAVVFSIVRIFFYSSDSVSVQLSIKIRQLEALVNRFQADVSHMFDGDDLSPLIAENFSIVFLREKFVYRALDVLRAERDLGNDMRASRLARLDQESLDDFLVMIQNLAKARKSFNTSWDVFEKKFPGYLEFSKFTIYAEATYRIVTRVT